MDCEPPSVCETKLYAITKEGKCILEPAQGATFRHLSRKKLYDVVKSSMRYPYIHDALNYLSLTQQGKQIIANLYSHVFVVDQTHSTGTSKVFSGVCWI